MIVAVLAVEKRGQVSFISVKSAVASQKRDLTPFIAATLRSPAAYGPRSQDAAQPNR